ncbi:hypothetical protein EHW99_2654 [Erwinia amylovora]|uniref:Uncharacterized protein n=3 Tax=Erwinia amylovora TaxID=552 RepID=A0A831EPL5_ERWAM|nr:hypothetical protein EaACW_0935 [Erwinia amylovora ACW56400]QJQ55356.1 hypothetical protein EHX00_2654 [Erwinia amylovora]CBA19876.1 hypothetical protein predicted by Glimmer/Critica [Erwinia amylovora CFBP1430]CBX79775.1 hypothetical protein predicted by Glimmer/Critica [Erwinia amylovora ATCC BAA-2158]CCO77778.1 hypothetical protein BN432_0956 [Erwinia amylovora Ea356]CCO81565.1 hypothetical protein BN433_0970 [Erwinia amylovora Ea266]CCO85366.1 hypothetical protein BN434_0954 [Erwinia a
MAYHASMGDAVDVSAAGLLISPSDSGTDTQ